MFESIVFGFGLVLFFLSWYNPLPYGRFSDQIDLPLKIIPNRWFIGLANLPALVCLCFQTGGLSDLGYAVLAFLFTHFGFRSVVVPIVTGFIYTSDEKKVSVLTLTPLAIYNGFVGWTLAYMCTSLKGSMGDYWMDWPLLIGAGTCLLLNVYYDIYVNYLRCHGDDLEMDGMYIKEESLCKYFDLMFALGITNPNYFFEIVEWGLILLLTWHTESFAYLISTVLILWTRGLHNSLWYICNK
jgi:hypothetical protein